MLEDLKPPGTYRSCKVDAVMATLTDTDKAILAKAIGNPEWPIAALSRAILERGIQLSGTPLTNHRNKACACFR
jgi:hypothetical protein